MSIRTKLQLSIIGLVLLICVGTIYVFYKRAHEVAFDQVRSYLATVANCAAVQIDAKALNSLQTRKDESSREYIQIKRILKQLENISPDIKHAYTLRPGKRKMVWQFVVDAEEKSNEISHIGDDYNVSSLPELRAALSGPNADTNLYEDQRGSLISGYAPINDKSGHAVGIVGVDMSAAQLNRELLEMRQTGILCILVAALLSIVLGNALSCLIISPITPFIERLNAAARGDLETLADDRRSDELGAVARTFNDMLISLKLKDRMLAQMNTDFLTGLNNHRYFQQRLNEEVELCESRSSRVSLLMIDIDRFKLVNDSLGHKIGDNVLQHVAGLLSETISENRVVSRYGGEEFTIILPDYSSEEALCFGEKLRHFILDHPFTASTKQRMDNKDDSISISVSISVGVATYPDHSTEADGLIMAADIALYRAKHLGRNNTCVYNASVKDGYTDPYHVYTFIQDPSKCAIEALAAAVDARDHYTRNHSENVSKYACDIGDRLGLNGGEMERLRLASLLHDVGKIGVPDRVLNKPSSLTGEETEVIRTHPAVGEAIVRNSRNLDEILPGILYHHEFYDGQGYPSGLSGEEIPLLARIISVADSYDALTTDRPYRRALSPRDAIELIWQNSGTQFDPEIVEIFIQTLKESDSEPLDQVA